MRLRPATPNRVVNVLYKVYASAMPELSMAPKLNSYISHVPTFTPRNGTTSPFPCPLRMLNPFCLRNRSVWNVPTDTLANVAQARALVLLELTARPAWVFNPIAMVTADPCCVHVTPSVE